MTSHVLHTSDRNEIKELINTLIEENRNIEILKMHVLEDTFSLLNLHIEHVGNLDHNILVTHIDDFYELSVEFFTNHTYNFDFKCESFKTLKRALFYHMKHVYRMAKENQY